MAVITLTTDWNKYDYYLASVKGSLLRLCPQVPVVDICHFIPPFNFAQAAFVLKNSFKQFPEGSIHVIDVNSEATDGNGCIAVYAEGHFFVTADNGIFGLLLKDPPEQVTQVRKPAELHSSFLCLDVFVPVAAQLANGVALAELGATVSTYKKSIPLRAAIDGSSIAGSVIYIDSYQNAITNITRELFERVGKGRRFEIFIQSNHYKVDTLNKSYNGTIMGEILALFNSVSLLEIAINNGNAAGLLNLQVNSPVRVKFYD